jgi:hypothetical protein
MEIVFAVNVAWLATHELDAIQRHEWRIFQTFTPFMDRLSDARMYQLFTAAHIPVFAALIWAGQYEAFQIGFDVFLVGHIGLHWLFRDHPHNEFNNWFSQFLIIGVAPLAVLHLGLIIGG